MNKNSLTIAFSIVIAGALIAVGIIFSSDGSLTNPDDQIAQIEQAGDELEPNGAAVLGDPDAPVTIVEFGDFQCPYCTLFASNVEPLIRSEYIETGKVKMIFKTLVFLDDQTPPAESYLSALAGECAKEQGAFWAMHDAIYSEEFAELESGIQPENNGNLSMDFFEETAQSLGLDSKQLVSCIEDQKPASQLERYEFDAQRAMPTGVSTPAVFINDHYVSGLRSFEEYKAIIDSELGL